VRRCRLAHTFPLNPSELELRGVELELLQPTSRQPSAFTIGDSITFPAFATFNSHARAPTNPVCPTTGFKPHTSLAYPLREGAFFPSPSPLTTRLVLGVFIQVLGGGSV
jgi:hypothetical protein